MTTPVCRAATDSIKAGLAPSISAMVILMSAIKGCPLSARTSAQCTLTLPPSAPPLICILGEPAAALKLTMSPAVELVIVATRLILTVRPPITVLPTLL